MKIDEEDYKRLKEEDFIKIAKEFYLDGRKVYLVMYREKWLDFPVVYNNKRFVIFKIPL